MRAARVARRSWLSWTRPESICASARRASTPRVDGQPGAHSRHYTSGGTIPQSQRRSHPQPSEPSPSTTSPPSTTPTPKRPSDERPSSISVLENSYPTDPTFNVPPNIIAASSRRLHLQPDHPISITRRIIEAQFPSPTFQHHRDLHPVVTTRQNFDSLGFPAGHPGRAQSDTYYINRETLFRTHTSAHQAEIFRENRSEGFLVSADVYRRDAIDRSHYPVFHQMEGARMWDRTRVPGGDVAAAVRKDLDALPTHSVEVEDPNPPFHDKNPRQASHHSAAESEAIGTHLKRSLELMAVRIFSLAKAAASRDPDFVDEPLKVRWVDAYFPFTSPSWELEIYFGGEWLEVLGCGVVKQDLFVNAGVPDQLGWAFGLGLDRLAMLLFNIPDIRLFWSRDARFLGQFAGVEADLDKLRSFVPFSKYPASYKDVSFWIPKRPESVTGRPFHENDVMEIVRTVAGDLVEDVKLIDDFRAKNGRRSNCYRITFRSMERTLRKSETLNLHAEIRDQLTEKLGVELRL